MDLHQWFETFRQSDTYALLKKRPLAYFCAEFALEDGAPTYAGGLGILASDMIHEARDQQIPLVAVGLYYHEGYLHHELYAEGTMLKRPMKKVPADFGFQQVRDANNNPLLIAVPLQGRSLYVSAWERKMGSVRLLLLDTDIPENDQQDRSITNRLYVANKEIRFKQEMVLGIGGVRMLAALQIHPMIYHMNEGHSALLALEVSHHEMNEYKKSFVEELERAHQHIVFTNHTLVAAGNDMFSNDMVALLLNDYSQEVRVPVHDLIKYGSLDDSSIFSMTTLALRMANKINAVSKLHAEKANELWKGYTMLPVTNGVHLPTWDKIQVQTSKIKDQNDNTENNLNFWQKHQTNKRELLAYIQKKLGVSWDENHLLIGWARRMVGYKRPLSLFYEKENLKKLLTDEIRPIRVVMAGSAHESDEEGAKILAELQQMIINDFKGYVVYLPDYSLLDGKLMTAGCDVWLNTPVVGFEACGTSGMKACLNGVLPISTKDGWMAEINSLGIGWILDSDHVTDSVLSTLEDQVKPLYYTRDSSNIPGGWIENMEHARRLIVKDYSATRMVKQYIEAMYRPSIELVQK